MNNFVSNGNNSVEEKNVKIVCSEIDYERNMF